MVTLLQSTLAGATTSFQDILEVRTQNMKASKDRSEQFMFANSAAGGLRLARTQVRIFTLKRNGIAMLMYGERGALTLEPL